MFRLFVSALCDLFRSRASLEAEIVVLRQQVAVLRQRLGSRRVRLSWRDRMFGVGLSRVWPGWRAALVIVRPETVLRWHREGFRAYWRWKARPRGGRPRVDRETRELISGLQRENPLWGAPRIHGELLMLGIDVSESTVSKYLGKSPRPPSQSWRTFVRNQLHQSIAIDFAVVPTIRFSLRYVCVVLDHGRRRILHVNVTANPTAAWAAQQVVEALPWETNAEFLFRDGDGIYGEEFTRRVTGLGLQQVVTARASPWQNGYCERVIGTLRRECLDHVVAINERQLKGVLDCYVRYYNQSRTHLSLAKDSPAGRKRASRWGGAVVAFPEAGGLHHRYERLAA
ncbi:MAG TPA: integrase core domain-containing protein [Candidatus Binatia bacterium]